MTGSIRQSRRRLASALAIAVLGLALWLALGDERGVPGPVASRAALPLASLEGAPPPIGAAASTTTAGETLPEPVRRYLESHAYPPTSGRLTTSAVDLLQPNRRWEEPRIVPDTLGDDAEVQYLFTAQRYYYNTDETVEARLEVKRADKPTRVEILSATAQPEARGGASGEPLPLAFKARGGAQVADLRLASDLADHHGPVRLHVRFRYAEERSHDAAIRIFVTPESRIPATFDGRFQDYELDGSLIVEVGVDVEQPGFYRLDANAFDAQGAPVAFASYKGPIESGPSMVKLQFFGKAFREAGLDGPYSIEQLRGYRFLDGEYPDREPMRPFPGTWRTNRYAATEFAEADFDSEHKRRMVELMMEDVRAGRSLDVPTLAVDDGTAPPAAESLVRDVERKQAPTADESPTRDRNQASPR